VLLRALASFAAALLLAQAPEVASPWFSKVFPPDEYRARRARVYAEIGEGVAILQGAAERPSESPFRQNSQFIYLTGIEVPRAIAVLDGRTKTTTVYLPDNSRRSRQYGPLLEAGDKTVTITGVDAALPREQFDGFVSALAGSTRPVFTPYRAEVLGSGSAGDAAGFVRATAQDPWDGRISREQAFIEKLKQKAHDIDVRDLDPILDQLRFIKSAREIAVVREATRITGLGIMQAMREAKPGLFEYELFAAAEYIFRKNGAQGAAYFPLSATGRNTIYSHYHRGAAKLADGDLVQFDYAPDWNYYVSDVTRVFPANGRFTAWQREWYTIYLRLYQSLMTSIRPGVPVSAIIADAVKKMDVVLAGFHFTDPGVEAAAKQFVGRYRESKARSLGHAIGIEVHDVGRGGEALAVGQIFTIEPAMQIPERSLGIRLEDAILITSSGYENLSAFVPVEIADIERLMRR